jgi:hypothetical protein
MGPRINSRYPFFLDLSGNVVDTDTGVGIDEGIDEGIEVGNVLVSDMGNEDDTDNKVIEFVPIMSILVILIIILLYI